MTPLRLTFRVFVSSTFADLREERNALHLHVFPRLRELCAAHGCRFQAIDLRWGIREEAALDHQTMRICLEEIARCQRVTPRPNFVILLGDRCGWRPLPAEIPETEFEAIAARIEDAAGSRLLRDWYELDGNGVPPVFRLRPRGEAFRDGKVWFEKVERPLHEAICRAVAAVELGEDRRLAYSGSAVEQEVAYGALASSPGAGQVFCFAREIENLDEVRSQAARTPKAREYVDSEPDAEARVAAQRRRLQRALGKRFFRYRTRWTGDALAAAHIERLCRDVLESLSGAIRREISSIRRRDALKDEIETNRNFGRERSRHFAGRAGILDRLLALAADAVERPVAVRGSGGVGKTALMARAAELLQTRYPAAEVIVRYAGATPASSDARSLLEGLVNEIARRYGVRGSAPSDYRQLIVEFRRRLASASAERPLFVLVDGLDQLTAAHNARSLVWLPRELPPHAHLAVSALDGTGPLAALERRLPRERILTLGPMALEEGAEALDSWLREAGRTLRPDQRHEVLERFAANGLPLYLKLCFEEARRWRSTTPPVPLPGELPTLVRALMERLGAEHGPLLVARCLGYLAASRNGLTEDEILDLLSRDTEFFRDFLARAHHDIPSAGVSGQQLPVAVWSRLYFDLQPYLTTRAADQTNLLTFYHRQLGEYAAERYLEGEGGGQLHERLTQYFDEQPLWLAEQAPNVRKTAELPYQQAKAQKPQELENTLGDLEFIEAKCAAGMAYDLIADYDEAGPLVSPRLARYRSFVTAHEHIFHRDPGAVTAFGYNYADGGPVVENAVRRLDGIGWRSRPWIELADRAAFVRDPALLFDLTGHAGEVLAVALTRDGRTAVSGGADSTLRVWDTHAGACSQVIVAHHGPVTGVAVSRNGEIGASTGSDGQVRIWDLRDGTCRHSFSTATGEALSVALDPEGKLVAAGCEDGLLRLWRLPSGEPLAALDGHFGPVTGVALGAQGTLAVSSGADAMVRVWNLEEGRTQACLQGHMAPARAVSLDDDGQLIASCCGQDADAGGIVAPALLHASDVRFWNTEGECLSAERGHELADRGGRALGVLATVVYTIALSGDGSTAVSGGYDKTVVVWDAAWGRPRARLYGHFDRVLAVAIDYAGQIAVSAGTDGGVRVWKLTGSAPPLPPPKRRIGRIGRGRRAGLLTRANLIWRNGRIRKVVLYPLLSAAACLIPPQLFAAVSDFSAAARWGRLQEGLGAAFVLASNEWRQTLRAATRASDVPVFPKALRILLSLTVAPLFAFFPVLNCPLCGNPISGRRGLFHCRDCGFRDSWRRR